MVSQRQKRTLTPGKLRGLQQCASPEGIFTILALDHRRVVQETFGGSPQGLFPAAAAFKKDVVAGLAPAVTAVLLDPQFGGGPQLSDGSLPGGLGLLLSVEKSGYSGTSGNRLSRVAQGWGVDKIKRCGASAVKFLAFYHPESPHAEATRQMVAQVAEECRRCDLAYFLEPMSFKLETEDGRRSSRSHRQVVVQTAADLSGLGADILKVEFPEDAAQVKDEGAWAEACAELDAASAIPWVLLSAAVDYDTFLRQSELACQAGASGILAGRSIWKEALGMGEEARREFLNGLARQRMQRLREVCQHSARPFTGWVEYVPAGENWPQEYAGF